MGITIATPRPAVAGIETPLSRRDSPERRQQHNTTMKTTVIHHSADFDGLFCREIARKFLPEAELIGWDFGDKPLEIPPEGQIYILDLPVDRVFGFNLSTSEPTRFISQEVQNRIVWIDHHKSSIESHPSDIPGYRIDGVAACRLAWQWFSRREQFFHPTAGSFAVTMPDKQQFYDRQVQEPYAVRLAGEYDIWDKRDINAGVFQFGLRSRDLTEFDWQELLSEKIVPTTAGTGMDISETDLLTTSLLQSGHLLQRYQQSQDASIMHRSFIAEFEGLKFLVLNTARCNSLTFASKDVPETGHDALCGFFWTGKTFKVSLYHAKHRTDLDLSLIAVKHGGGGHRGACGFESRVLPAFCS